MGMLTIKIEGSFTEQVGAKFCAEEGGHALAIQRAISFLTDQLPSAIQLDHKLHDDGDRPPVSDFGKLTGNYS